MDTGTSKVLSDRAYNVAITLVTNSRFANARMALHRAVETFPSNLMAKLLLAILIIGDDDVEKTRSIWKECIEKPPNPEKIAEFERSVTEFNDSVLRSSQNSANNHVISMSTLGINGRFGNQLFQYAFLKLYSRYHNLKIQTPDWIGRYLFGYDDEHISEILPFRMEAEGVLFPPFQGPLTDGFKPEGGIDIHGFFEYHTSVYAPYKEYLFSLFTPSPHVLEMVEIWHREVRAKGETLVAVHLRRGDTARTERWSEIDPYLAELRSLWPNLQNPVLYLASDEIGSIVDAFKEFSPITSLGLKFPIQGAEFYPDFYLLTQSDILIGSRSTFSAWAAMLNRGARRIARVLDNKIVNYDPWNYLPV